MTGGHRPAAAGGEGEAMRVGFDEQVFLAQRRGGISRYVVNLVQSLQADPSLGVEPVPGWSFGPNAHAAEAGLARTLPVLDPLCDGRGAAIGMGGYFLANTMARRAARRADILHYTYTHPRFFAPHFRGLRVCTVYDMIPELYPESFPDRNPHVAKRRYVENCDVVLCISESTRNDLVRIYGDPGVAMPVTYLGVEPSFSPDAPRPAGLPERYLLFVGRRGGYKDFDVLAEAFAGLPDDGTVLAVVGGPLTDEESARLSALGIASRVRRFGADDSELPGFYAGALAFVFPSRHEGFGLPTLEAMASATVAVLADSSSHPEVGGDVARYFPPGDVEALRKVLAELLDDAVLRDDLARRGVARAAQFSWAATAASTAEAYRAAFGRESGESVA
jgi:glycosyltransferase involved in cell wall biosynthesis